MIQRNSAGITARFNFCLGEWEGELVPSAIDCLWPCLLKNQQKNTYMATYFFRYLLSVLVAGLLTHFIVLYMSFDI